MKRNVLRDIELYANEAIKKSCDSYNRWCLNSDPNIISKAETSSNAMLNVQLVPYSSFDDPTIIFNLSEVHRIAGAFERGVISNRELIFDSEGFVQVMDESFMRINHKSVFEYVTVDGFIPDEKRPNIMIGIVEPLIIKALNYGLTFMKKLNVPSPVLLKVGVSQCKGYRLFVDSEVQNRNREILLGLNSHEIKSETVISHLTRIDDYDGKAEGFLLGAFNLLWNAGGYPKSLNYDDNGEYIIR